jgi:CubicO group peptidase (beta-lactamase class C family)
MSPTLDPSGVERLHDALAGHVEAGALPGLAMLVAAGDDDVHVGVIGSARFGGPPLERDAIWRIASLTKPVVAAAALSMLADGTLALDQPIDDLLPELAGRRVLRAIDAELDDTVPAARPITVGDVLTYRMGLGSVMAPPGSFPIQRAEAALGLRSIGSPPWPPVDHDDDSWIAALGMLPLAHQPGAAWMYNTSGQVLGVLLARADGAPLEAVLRRRILDPLGMTDTSFTIAPDRQARLVTFYAPDADTGGQLDADQRAGNELFLGVNGGASGWARRRAAPRRRRCRAATAGRAGPARPGAPTPNRASPASCSRSGR